MEWLRGWNWVFRQWRWESWRAFPCPETEPRAFKFCPDTFGDHWGPEAPLCLPFPVPFSRKHSAHWFQRRCCSLCQNTTLAIKSPLGMGGGRERAPCDVQSTCEKLKQHGQDLLLPAKAWLCIDLEPAALPFLGILSFQSAHSMPFSHLLLNTPPTLLFLTATVDLLCLWIGCSRAAFMPLTHTVRFVSLTIVLLKCLFEDGQRPAS